MKQILFIVLLTMMLTTQIYALEPFELSPSNPISVTASYPNWQQTGVMQQSILFENGVYKMWYTSVGSTIRIAYATSVDGLSWTGQQLFEFIPNQDTHDPALIKVDNKYVLYFATTPSGQRTRIMKIESADGVSFESKPPVDVLLPDPTWDYGGTSSPALLYENGTYYMLYAGLSTSWKTRLATSNDGTSFTRCPSYFFDSDTVPKSIIKQNGVYYVFFHSSRGIEYAQSQGLSCSSSWTNRTVITPAAYFPYVLQKDNQLLLYYGMPINGVWNMFLRTTTLSTPIPTSAPTPTQTPTLKHPIVIIPGFFASWNKQALIHQTQTPQSAWTLNPLVKEYSGIETTLQNLGYEKNKDYFLFIYDWRKKMEDNAYILDQYIKSNNISKPFNIVGHSLGGLIGKIYTNKYGNNDVKSLVSVGSPHKGVAQVYKTVEGGEIETENTSFWLGQQLILQLYKDGVKTNKQIIAEKLPVAQELLPTTDFLYKNSEPITRSTMQMVNATLPSYTNTVTQLQSLVGEKGQTISGYTVTERTIIDRLLGLYPDGRPITKRVALGDYTVTSISASEQSNTIIPKDHGELIYSRDSIKEILRLLQIPFSESQIVEGKKTNITPSLFFLMMSPATLEVTQGTNTYAEHDGIVFIENPSNTTYVLKAKGTALGNYTVLIGQIGSQDTVWQKINGNITKAGQTDIYSLTYNKDVPTTQSMGGKNEIISYISGINKDIKSSLLTSAVTILVNCHGSCQTGVQNKLIEFIKRARLPEHKATVYEALTKLEYTYTRKNTNGPALQKEFTRFLTQWKPNAQQGQDTQMLMQIQTRLESIEKALLQKNYDYAWIMFKSVKRLLEKD